MTRNDKRKLTQLFNGMRSKAAQSFKKYNPTEWDKGYALGYDNAMKAVLEMIKEIQGDKE